RCLSLDIKFTDTLDEPFLCFGSKTAFRRQPIGIPPETVGLRDAIKQIGFDLSRKASKSTVTDRLLHICFIEFARLQVIPYELYHLLANIETIYRIDAQTIQK